ncbi:class I SAM-dependent methyltransferase [Roseibium sp.]|uniref:class I SAM-dependent methyltransferase n=1 Tax=Roseibium sp. TaxID=1936156 RepID=UPI003B52B406
MTDETTIKVYDTKAAEYAGNFDQKEPSGSLKTFMSHLPPGGRVLDWGCGPGMFSYHLKVAGYDPDPVDASAEMVALAREKYGIDARQGTFADPLDLESYHGIWANFSLLHAPRADLPGHIATAHAALRPDGILHIGMKRGTGEKRDKFGRQYTYVETEDLTGILESTGFEILKTHEGAEAGLAGTVDPFVLVLGCKR